MFSSVLHTLSLQRAVGIVVLFDPFLRGLLIAGQRRRAHTIKSGWTGGDGDIVLEETSSDRRVGGLKRLPRGGLHGGGEFHDASGANVGKPGDLEQTGGG